MKLALFAKNREPTFDRPAAARSAGGDGALRVLVFGLLLPITLILLGISGWYIVTGESPANIFARLTGIPRMMIGLPRVPGPVAPEATLMRPPSEDQSGVTVTMAPVPEPVPPAPPPAPTPVAPTPVAPTPVAPTPVPAEPAPAPAPQSSATPSTAPANPPAMAATAPVAETPPPPPVTEPVVPPGGETLAPPSFAQLPARKDLAPLPPGPDTSLLQNSPNGVLPITAGNKSPRQAYARPFSNQPNQARVAVIVTGLGLSREATDAAIAKLPPAVDLSFSPYASGLDGWVKKARAAGHEVLLDLPMEPPNFPTNDSGPMAILSQGTATQALQRLDGILAATNSYVGVAGTLRSPVTTSPFWGSVLNEIKQRGLLFVGDGLVGPDAATMPPSASVTLVADETPFRVAVDARLKRILETAKRDGKAVTYVAPRPVTFERLLAWSDSLAQNNAVLAPLSALTSSAP